jgi:hypothetical protein
MPHAFVLPVALFALQDAQGVGSGSGAAGAASSSSSSLSYEEGVRAAIRGGGCCASRAIAAGACLAALHGGEAGSEGDNAHGVPTAWVGRVRDGQQLLDVAVKLACLR